MVVFQSVSLDATGYEGHFFLNKHTWLDRALLEKPLLYSSEIARVRLLRRVHLKKCTTRSKEGE